MNWTKEDIDRVLARQKSPGGMAAKPAARLPVAKGLQIATPEKRKMNKTEAAYFRRLDALKANGEVSWFAFEPINIRLADNTYYRVDFMVMLPTGEIQMHEVKGFWRDDARVKIKVAAEMLPFRFVGCRLAKGLWEFEYF